MAVVRITAWQGTTSRVKLRFVEEINLNLSNHIFLLPRICEGPHERLFWFRKSFIWVSRGPKTQNSQNFSDYGLSQDDFLNKQNILLKRNSGKSLAKAKMCTPLPSIAWAERNARPTKSQTIFPEALSYMHRFIKLSKGLTSNKLCFLSVITFYWKFIEFVGFPSFAGRHAHHCATRNCVTSKIKICGGKKLKFIYYIFWLPRICGLPHEKWFCLGGHVVGYPEGQGWLNIKGTEFNMLFKY